MLPSSVYKSTLCLVPVSSCISKTGFDIGSQSACLTASVYGTGRPHSLPATSQRNLFTGSLGCPLERVRSQSVETERCASHLDGSILLRERHDHLYYANRIRILTFVSTCETLRPECIFSHDFMAPGDAM